MTTTDTSQWIELAGFSAPVISGMICLIVMVIFLAQNQNISERKLAWLLIAELTVCILSWTGVIVYTIDSVLYMYIEAPLRLCILYAQVITFHFVFTLTRTGVRERFNPINYLIPIILALLLLIWSQFVPESVRLSIIESRGDFPDSYEAYAFMATSNRRLFPIYSIVYAVLGLRRIIRYKHTIENYSANEGHSSVKWLFALIFITVAVIPMSVAPVVLGMKGFISSSLAILPGLLIVFKDVILTYNTIVQNYVIIEDSNEDEQAAEDERPSTAVRENGLTTDKLDAYMARHKPYLNPKLRIVDLIQDLCTNRTYLSGFINREYGMNFSRYINSYRLKELKKLRLTPAYSRMSGMELVQKAGFSSFRGYLRAKRLEDRETTLSD